MPEVMTVPKLAPETQELVCAALRTWAVVLADLHRALIDQGLPADAARDLTGTFWDQTLSAGYAEGDVE